jgi:hypothetical protein
MVQQESDATHTQVRENWHRLITPHGVFFGYSLQQVKEKADVAARRSILAKAEQQSFLELNDRQRGVRIC